MNKDLSKPNTSKGGHNDAPIGPPPEKPPAAMWPEKTRKAKNLRDLAIIGMEGIYDDEQGSTYIKVAYLTIADQFDAVVSLMGKKVFWQEHFPDKKIAAMTTIAEPHTIGLLIHYERRGCPCHCHE